MSKEIDEKVVSMEFDNKRFEQNVATSMSTLDKLKKSLNLEGAAKGLENINVAAKQCNMSGMADALDTVKAKFSALQVMGITALSNITNSAINAGKKIASALTIEPIKTGYQEYETQINAVQTILANTESKGSTLKDVNKALDELNTYADKTIYNFTEMTRNIGTFTAAGVDLDKSVSAIKGIANLAAISGSTSQQASTAMYQLSQALASGSVKLQDWNSVVNAGMGGQVFQDALKETARVHNIAIDNMIKSEGSFRETLKDGWLTSDILTETLNKFTGDLNEKQLRTMGYTDEQIKSIIKMGKTANDAATKVKTFTQLFDTLKESAQSGWTQSWETIIGDFEEAKKLLTDVSDVFSGIISASADARNKVLTGWKELGGRTMMIDSIRNAFEGIMSVVKPVKEAFREIFPPITAKQLVQLSAKLKDLTSNLKISGDDAKKIKSIFKGLFSVLEIGKKTLSSVMKPLLDFTKSDGIKSLTESLFNSAASIGVFFTSINEEFTADGITGTISKISSGISDFLTLTVGKMGNFKQVFASVGNVVHNFAQKATESLRKVFAWITDNVSIKDVFAGLAGGGIFLTLKKFGGVLDKIKGKIEDFFDRISTGGHGLADRFTNILDQMRDSLKSFSTGIKAGTLVSIALAVGILSASLSAISKLEIKDISKGIASIGAMFTMLNLSFKSITKSLNKFGSTGIIKAGLALIAMSIAIKIFSKALNELSDLTFTDISVGLTAIGVGLLELTGTLKLIEKNNVSIKTVAAMVVLAKSCKILSESLASFGSMSWEEIGRGLAAMGGALLELSVAMVILSKTGKGGTITGSIGILIVAQSLQSIYDVLIQFGSMSWEEIGRGLTAMGGALVELGLVIGILGKVAGFSGILGAVSILIVAQSLHSIYDVLIQFGSMSWEEIGRGLTAMGGALVELGLVIGILGKVAGFSGILGAVSILIAIQGLDALAKALNKFGSMSWEEIGRGLVAMGGALTELAGITSLLGSFAPLGAIVGSGSLLVAINGLDDLANALEKFGSMSWEEIGRGLAAMGGALGEIALGGLLNTLSGLGAASISKMAEPLGVLADSVKKWDGVSVPENLGLQLNELASGVMCFTFDGLGANAISSVAEPLGTLSDSVKKWSNVDVPDGIEDNLRSLANGVSGFTFSAIGANAIAASVEPLGSLAGSIKKWSNVSVPENLEDGLLSISKGVESFTWAFAGGWSIESIVEPLGNLPNSIKKWNDIRVPDNLESNLESISNGVKSFTWAFAGGWSISSVSEPLNALADAAKKLSSNEITDNAGTKLQSIAEGVKSFTGVSDISSTSESIRTITSSVSEFSKIDFGAMNAGINNFVKNVKKVSGINIDTSTLNSSISSIKSTMSKMMKTINSVIKSGKVSVVSSTKSTLSGMTQAIKSVKGSVTSATKNLLTNLIKVINNQKQQVSSAFKSTVSSSVNAIREKEQSFESAGKYLGSGLVIGINAKQTDVYNAAYALGQMAVQGEKDGQDSASPSKLTIQAGKWFGEGLIIGINKMSHKVYDASYNLGDTAVETMSSSISKVFSMLDSDIDAQPTIRPVLDLDQVSTDVGFLNGMLSVHPSIGVGSDIRSINSRMIGRNQNGNDDVVSEIAKLRKDISNMKTTVNQINGITYDDGSNINEAISTLVRAARVERRR